MTTFLLFNITGIDAFYIDVSYENSFSFRICLSLSFSFKSSNVDPENTSAVATSIFSSSLFCIY
jgi:hypothetical protein